MKPLFYKNHELFKEIFLNLKVHKTRTILTAFGIAWGIFLMVVLLGISGGLQDGVFGLFRGFSAKTIWFYGGTSNDNIALRDTGHEIRFKVTDLNVIEELIPNIKAISPEIQWPDAQVSFESETGRFNIKGTTSQTFTLKNLDMKEGRPIKASDIAEHREVAVIGDRAVNRFFNGKNPLGKYISINASDFLIIGVIENKSFLSMNEQNSIFIPFSSFADHIRPVDFISSIGITLKEGDTQWASNRIKTFLAGKYHFAKDDANALYIVNYEEQMSVFSKFFTGFNIFLVFVGCCLLLSGIIGVSNIMYIIVKERTREIGIKKAIGATQTAILKEFISESLVLTLLSGGVGYLLGMGALSIVDLLLANLPGEDQIITHTVIEPEYLILAIIILSFFGLLAGFFPAQKAAGIKPMEAMTNL